MKINILLVEDNETIVLGLKYLFEQEGYSTVSAGTVREAREYLRKKHFDLALLDISLPDADGYTLCEEIKRENAIPVIFLTAREEERDVVKGLDLGAEDYVIKPFRNRELLSRIRNVLRRNPAGSKFLSCGEISMNIETGKVYVSGEEVTLTKLEYRILQSLLSYPGKVFTREEILAEVWDASGNFVNDNTLSVTMKRIREKLGNTAAYRIQTVRGLGYRLEKE